MGHHAFICHSSEDAEAAVAVCAGLESSGVRCWIAPRNALPGIPYARQLVEAIADCAVVILIFSSRANASRAVLNEIELASNRDRIILPFRIESVPPSPDLEFYIRSVHWFDATSKPLRRAVDDLANVVGDLVSAAIPAQTRIPSGSALQHNLPAHLTPLVGREREIAEMEALLDASRLVTIAGTGGVGKTRCALRVGIDRVEAFHDGVWFVDLSPIEDGALVASTIAATLGLQESPNQPIFDTVLAYLKSKQLLLILDNCEQIIAEAARHAEAIVRSCRRVTIIATTREALSVEGERLYRLPPLDVPTSVNLFADRAKQLNDTVVLNESNAAIVADICRRLDGIPLAIELAVSRTKTMSVKALAEKLDERFGLLTSGSRTALPRQQTLRALIDWSYELLPEPERVQFRWLGTFVGPFTFELAVKVSSNEASELDVLDRLSSLMEKSLVQVEISETESRYRLLESIREYALDKLTSNGELGPASRAHALAFTDLAERMEQRWDVTADQQWNAQSEPELENWRAALRWAFGPNGDASVGQRLAAALRPVWIARASEGRRWVEAGLGVGGDRTPPRVLARLELTQAHLAMLGVQYRVARSAAERALEICLTLHDEEGAALARLFSGAAMGLLGEAANGERLLQSALTVFDKVGARRSVGAALGFIATIRLRAGEPDEARPLFARALEAYREVGAMRPAASVALQMAEIEFQRGDAQAAVDLVSEALATDRAHKDLDAVAFDLCNLAAYLVELERWPEAAAIAREALELATDRQIDAVGAWAIQHLAAIAALRSAGAEAELELRRRAARLAGFANSLFALLEIQRDFTEQKEYDRLLASLSDFFNHDNLAQLLAEGDEWSRARALAESARI